MDQTSRRASIKENKQIFEGKRAFLTKIKGTRIENRIFLLEGTPETNVTNKMIHKIKDETTDGVRLIVSRNLLKRISLNIC